MTMCINNTFIKKNGMSTVVLIGFHPTKDFVAVSSGIEDDIRFIPFKYFYEEYELI